MKKENGFTLIELLVTVAVVSILLAIGVPEYKRITENNRMVGIINKLAGDLNLARSEAIKQGRSVSMCASSNGASCNGGSDWSNGWVAFTDSNRDGIVNNADVLLLAQTSIGAGMNLRATGFTDNSRVVFMPSGRLATGSDPDGTFILCDTRQKDVTRARAINLNVLGRVSLARDTDGSGTRNDVEGNDITCP